MWEADNGKTHLSLADGVSGGMMIGRAAKFHQKFGVKLRMKGPSADGKKKKKKKKKGRLELHLLGEDCCDITSKPDTLPLQLGS